MRIYEKGSRVYAKLGEIYVEAIVLAGPFPRLNGRVHYVVDDIRGLNIFLPEVDRVFDILPLDMVKTMERKELLPFTWEGKKKD